MIRCLFERIKNFLTFRSYISPHVYVWEKKYKSNIAVGEDYFREIEGYEHNNGETVIENAIILVSKCVHCGHIDKSWFNPGTYEYFKADSGDI